MPEATEADLTLYYAPRTRAFTALWLLEELGQPYRLESFDLASGRHKRPDYLALNPMGKVPLVVHRGVPVPELGAIAIYLADSYRDAGLAPPLDAPSRPAFLRWVFFATAIMEPAYSEKFFNWQLPSSNVAWGSFAQMSEIVTAGVQPGPWLLGDTFTSADVLVASTLRFGQLFGAMPKEGPTADYVARATAREAFARALAIDEREGARFPPKKTA
ncbi:MAG TPA: glutathione S-transferase [Myxococcaceae bacterium]|nr:glutathione S-transferase [Myxococcaceae bacterium]